MDSKCHDNTPSAKHPNSHNSTPSASRLLLLRQSSLCLRQRLAIPGEDRCTMATSLLLPIGHSLITITDGAGVKLNRRKDNTTSVLSKKYSLMPKPTGEKAGLRLCL